MKLYRSNLLILTILLLLSNGIIETANHNHDNRELFNILPLDEEIKYEEYKVSEEYSHHNTPLHQAAKLGDTEEVKRIFLYEDYDINAKNNHNKSALDLACENGHKRIVELFMKSKRYKLNIMNLCNETPLHTAVRYDDHNKVESLLGKKANPNALDLTLTTPLHEAVFKKDINMVKSLLDHKANPNAQAASGDTPLHYAYPSNNSILSYLILNVLLINEGADINIQNKGNLTPLDRGINIGYTNMVKLSLLINELNNDKNLKSIIKKSFNLISLIVENYNLINDINSQNLQYVAQVNYVLDLTHQNINRISRILDNLPKYISQIKYALNLLPEFKKDFNHLPEIIDRININLQCIKHDNYIPKAQTLINQYPELHDKCEYLVDRYFELNNKFKNLINEFEDFLYEIMDHNLERAKPRDINSESPYVLQAINTYNNYKKMLNALCRAENKFENLSDSQETSTFFRRVKQRYEYLDNDKKNRRLFEQKFKFFLGILLSWYLIINPIINNI